MRLKKIVLIVIAAIFAVMLAVIIVLIVKMNGEHKAYLDTADQLAAAEKNLEGLTDQLKDAKKTIAAYEGTEADESLDGDSAGDSSLGGLSISDIATYDLSDDLTIRLATDPEVKDDHYVQVAVTLSLNTGDDDYATYSGTLSTNEGLIKDTINKVIGAYTYTKLQSTETTDVQKAILKELRKMYNSNFIVGVSFSSWFIQ